MIYHETSGTRAQAHTTKTYPQSNYMMGGRFKLTTEATATPARHLLWPLWANIGRFWYVLVGVGRFKLTTEATATPARQLMWPLWANIGRFW